MKVTIITVCFNRVGTIAQAIESVLAQDYPDIEYLIIDGASKDGSLAVIQRYGNEKRVTRIVSEPDNGMYEAINKGIRLATGDVIGLLHSDDFFYDNHVISDVARIFAETDADGGRDADDHMLGGVCKRGVGLRPGKIRFHGKQNPLAAGKKIHNVIFGQDSLIRRKRKIRNKSKTASAADGIFLYVKISAQPVLQHRGKVFRCHHGVIL